ncbi:hypothetical protein TYRP_000077, partial [Tyrophagus putrescentiae]
MNRYSVDPLLSEINYFPENSENSYVNICDYFKAFDEESFDSISFHSWSQEENHFEDKATQTASPLSTIMPS